MHCTYNKYCKIFKQPSVHKYLLSRTFRCIQGIIYNARILNNLCSWIVYTAYLQISISTLDPIVLKIHIFTSLQITFQPTIHRFKETNNDSLLITVAVNQYFKDYNESSIGSLISMHVACTVWICLLFFPGHTK